MKPQVYLTSRLPPEVMNRLLRETDLACNSESRPATRAELLSGLKGRQGLLCNINDRIDAGIINSNSGASLKVVANFGVGFNHIDVAAATARKIAVTNTPGVLTDATADMAFALLLAVARRVVESDRFLRQGKFKGWKADLLLGNDVYGRTLGIIGFGRIGQAVARRGLGFNMSILYSDARRVGPEVESELRAQYVPLDELLRKADYVTIHADLNDQTRHMIGERELKLMGPEHYLINAARGPIVDEKALVRALKERWIKGAGLDVYEKEPQTEAGLTDCWNALLLPHLGSATVTARAAMAETAASNLIAAVEGQRPPNLVNPDALVVRR